MSGVHLLSWRKEDAVDELELPAHGIAASAVAVAVLSSFIFGYSIGVLDSCGELISVVFKWCGNDWESDCVISLAYQGGVNAAIYLGATVGALLVGRPGLAKKGSRTLLCIADVLFLVGGMRCATAQGSNALICGRIVSGLGLGIVGVATPLYICEVAPREHRGLYTMMHQVVVSLGILASIALGLPQSAAPGSHNEALSSLDTWYWRGLLGLPALPALLQILLFWWVFPFDPPGLLISQGRIPEARRCLYKIYGIDSPDESRLVGAVQQARAISVEFQFQELLEATETAQSLPRIPIMLAFFDPFLRCALYIGFGLAAFQQLCGINAVMSYSNSFFREAGITSGNLTLASTVMAAMNLLMSLATAKVVDRWGRRSLLLGGTACQTLAMAVLSLCLLGPWGSLDAPAPLVIACFCFFVMSFAGGVGAVTWLYLAEIYPLEIRGAALAGCGSLNWFCSFAVVFASRLLSLRAVCQVFGIICFLGLWVIYLWVVETKGCSMDDSPMTPRNDRSRSPLLTPIRALTRSPSSSKPTSPKTSFTAWQDDQAMTVSEKMALMRVREEADH